jgi:hypothetical protein
MKLSVYWTLVEFHLNICASFLKLSLVLSSQCEAKGCCGKVKSDTQFYSGNNGRKNMAILSVACDSGAGGAQRVETTAEVLQVFVPGSD